MLTRYACLPWCLLSQQHQARSHHAICSVTMSTRLTFGQQAMSFLYFLIVIVVNDSWGLLSLVTWDGNGLGPECVPDKGSQHAVGYLGLMQGLPGRLLAPPFQVDLQPGVV